MATKKSAYSNLQIQDVDSDLGLKSVKVPILSAAVLALNTTPITLIPAPGVGKMIELISAFGKLIFNSIAYSTTLEINLITDTAEDLQIRHNDILGATQTVYKTFNKVASTGAADSSLVENKAVNVFAPTQDPTAGDSDIIIYVIYRIVNV